MQTLESCSVKTTRNGIIRLFLVGSKIQSASSVIDSTISQMSYSLVMILELSGVSEVQYKEIMIIGDE